MAGRQEIIEEILNIEWEMFKNVRSLTPVQCQNNPDVFHKIRASIYEIWSEELLRSYLRDLIRAKEKGRNLMTEKYARMDGVLPPLPPNPKIDEIVEIETQWQEEIKKRYPALYNFTCRKTDPTGDGSNFSIYLRSELETYGKKTIDLYHAEVTRAKQRGENLGIRMLDCLVKKGGFKNIDHAESQLKQLAEHAKHE